MSSTWMHVAAPHGARYVLNLLLCGALLAPVCAGAQDQGEPAGYLFYFIGGEGSALLGARQGMSEARLQGRFLGQDYRLVQFPDAAALPAPPLPAVAIVADLPDAALLSLARAQPGIPVFNVGSDAAALRTACLPNLLHIQPSRRMKDDALDQWQDQHPQSEAQARAWHHEFKKFAARDLNKRFRKAAGVGMEDAAWAGWAAVKMSADLIARGDAGSAQTLLAGLRTGLTFDGQKGEAMNFRANGQLRQPVLLVEKDRPVGEAPVRGKDRDSLGANNACPPGT